MVEVTPGLVIATVLVIVWQMVWKILALWRAAKSHQKIWFVILTVLSPLTISGLGLFGIFDIVYLFFFAKHKLTIHEMTTWFSKKK